MLLMLTTRFSSLPMTDEAGGGAHTHKKESHEIKSLGGTKKEKKGESRMHTPAQVEGRAPTERSSHTTMHLTILLYPLASR